MPLPGGPSDKFGNRYEGRWTVRCMFSVLDETNRSLRLEGVDELDQGAEFYLITSRGIREYHQVKRQRAAGPWSIAALADAGVLDAFRSKLNKSQACCVFVSGTSSDRLKELSERGDSATSFAEFGAAFLGTSERLRGEFETLAERWGFDSREETFTALRRVILRNEDEVTLREEVEYRARTIVDGDPSNVVDVLAQFALESIHKELHADQIWKHLEERGFRRRDWANDDRVLGAVQRLNESYLDTIRGSAIAGVPIPRRETDLALERFEQHSRTGVLLTGTAGTGKSGVVAQLVEHFCDVGWPVLVFRMDRIQPTLTTEQLGEQVGLPGSPAQVLGAIAAGRPCVLVIDQLDAVSKTSGRHPELFDRVRELIRDAGRHPEMRLLLACREFDLDNDDQLRRLCRKDGPVKKLSVGPIDTADVHDVLGPYALNSRALSARQVELLTIPLHLKLMTRVLERSEPDDAKSIGLVETLNDLLDIYWKHVDREVRARLGQSANLTGLIDDLLSRLMADHALATDAGFFEDRHSRELDILVSEGVLLIERRRVGFFHEALFDYLFARRFVNERRDLCDFLRSEGQHLFLRATVRQVLTYSRHTDAAPYLEWLYDLLTQNDIRFHLKALTCSWLKELDEPRAEEWTIVQKAFGSDDQDLANHVWTVLSKAPWFLLAHERGDIDALLVVDDETIVMRALDAIGRRVHDWPNGAADYAFSFLEKPDPWPKRAVNIVSFCRDLDTRRFVELVCTMFRRGLLELESGPFHGDRWGFLDLPKNHPEWAIEVLESWLREVALRTLRRGNEDPFEQAGLRYGEFDPGELATKAPAELAERILHIVLEVSRLTAVRHATLGLAYSKPPWDDPVWVYANEEPRFSVAGKIFAALVEALRCLARTSTAQFRKHVRHIREYLDYKTAGLLLALGYTANGAEYADEAAVFMVENRRWLELGVRDASYWVSRQLLEAITPHCSNESYERLERAVLRYTSRWERRNLRMRDWGKLSLLPGLAPHRRSSRARRIYGELRRRFGREEGNRPGSIEAEFVGPPFDARWEAMSDEHWLSAIAKYTSEPVFPFEKGPQQLSSKLRERAKAEPVRFAELLSRVPLTANPFYFKAVLWGLQEAKRVEPTVIWAAIRACERLPTRPCGNEISRLIERYADTAVPVDILSCVIWHATECRDPEDDAWKRDSTGGRLWGGDPEAAGLNCCRGAAADALAKLLFAHEDYLPLVRPALDRMVDDPVDAVRTQVARTLLPVLNLDRDLAVDLFLRLTNGVDDAVLGCRPVVRFLRYTIYSHYETVAPLLRRMLSSSNEQASRNAARVFCLSALVEVGGEDEARRCLSGPEPQRLGLAEVAGTGLTAPNRALCEDILLGLFNDESDDVRRHATRWLYELKDDALGQVTHLLRALIDVDAFPEHLFSVFRALNKTTASLPDIVIDLFETAVSIDESASGTGRVAYMVEQNLGILLRLYEGTTTAQVRERCLDIIDRTSRTSSRIDRSLDAYEGRPR